MDRFDNDLREALRRSEAPPGLAARVMAQARKMGKATPRRPSFAWRWAATAAAVLVLIAGSFLYRDRVRQAEGEKAKEQVMFALRVTGAKLQGVRERLSEIQERRIDTSLK